MTGDGTPGGTFIRVVDSDGGQKYLEVLANFMDKYELVLGNFGPRDANNPFLGILL